jgi:predicted AlkP superfamily phosphohydrolase/phosphomutase
MSDKVKIDRIIVLGLDGATFDIIDPMIEQGKLPNLKKMITNGSRGILNSVIPPYSPPAWMSMLTGKNPGKHGVFHFLKRKKQSYDLEVASFRDVNERNLFSILTKEGVGSGAMNIPLTYPPPRNVKGFFVSGIPVPPNSRSYAVPDKMNDTLEKAGYRVDLDFRGFDPNSEDEDDRWDDYQSLLERLIEIAKKRVDIFLDLMDKNDLPLLFFVISLTDRVQHYFWRFTDKNHPGYSEEGERRFGDAIQLAYMVTDELIGRIIAKGGDETNYLVVSDHGAGPHYGDFYLNRWLEENEFLVRKKIPRWVIKQGSLSNIFSRLGIGFVADLLPESVRSKKVNYPGKKRFPDNADIIWSRTEAFASMYGIRINQRGREPAGIVEPGKPYQDVVNRIRKSLENLDNPLDGRKLLTRCMTKEEVFTGPHLDGSPDLFLNLGDITVIPSESWMSNDICVPRKKCPSSGTHRIEGVFIGKGPGILKGKDVGELRIEDIMPTLLYLFDIPLPKDLDGEVIMEAMTGRRPVRFYEGDAVGDTGLDSHKGYTDEEEDQITENLRGMGYI